MASSTARRVESCTSPWVVATGAQRRLRAVSAHLRAERTSNDAGGGPLAGVKVVEWTTAVQGPAAGQYLRDMGASVIKIEGPVGDGNRHGRGTQNNLVSASSVDLALRASGARGRVGDSHLRAGAVVPTHPGSRALDWSHSLCQSTWASGVCQST